MSDASSCRNRESRACKGLCIMQRRKSQLIHMWYKGGRQQFGISEPILMLMFFSVPHRARHKSKKNSPIIISLPFPKDNLPKPHGDRRFARYHNDVLRQVYLEVDVPEYQWQVSLCMIAGRCRVGAGRF